MVRTVQTTQIIALIVVKMLRIARMQAKIAAQTDPQTQLTLIMRNNWMQGKAIDSSIAFLYIVQKMFFVDARGNNG